MSEKYFCFIHILNTSLIKNYKWGVLLNQDEYIGNIVKNGVIALIIGFIITGILYSVMYSINGIEMYAGFIILGALYGFLFIKLDIFENELDLIITNAVFAFFGSYVSIHLIFTSALKIAMNSSLLTYQFIGICIIAAVVVNYIRDTYLEINPLGSINLNLGKLPTVICPECGVEVNAENIFCPECGHKFSFIHCPECGAKLDEEGAFCQECGHKLEDDSKKEEVKEDNSKKDISLKKEVKEDNSKKEDNLKSCSNCGTKVSEDSKFCPECGNKIR